jgi:mRNA-degrading endonuclease YafQ of YafQ-DinJ toxin-antitoxin module
MTMLRLEYSAKMKKDAKRIQNNELILTATRTGTHSDFGW